MEQFQVSDSLPVKSGYYYHRDLDVLWNYVKKCVRAWGSVLLSLHGAGTWQKPTETTVHVEFMHSKPLDPLVVDKDIINDEILERNLLEYIQNYFKEEIYQVDLIGSGWSMVEITAYFAKVAPYIPFTPISSRKTVIDVHTSAELAPALRRLGQFQIALALALNTQHEDDDLDVMSINPRRLRSKGEQVKLRKWMIKNRVPQVDDVTPGNLAWWHEELFKRGNIRVINNRGNILYARQFAENDVWATLYFNSETRRWYPVTDVENFLRIKRTKAYYCKTCQRFHPKGVCVNPKVRNEYLDQESLINFSPPRRFFVEKKALVVYADFEAFITKNDDGHPGKHVPAGYAWTVIYKGKQVATKVCDYTEVEDLMTAFIEDLFAIGKKYQRMDVDDVQDLNVDYDGDEEAEDEEVSFPVVSRRLIDTFDEFLDTKGGNAEHWQPYHGFYEKCQYVHRVRDPPARCQTCGKAIDAIDIRTAPQMRSYITGIFGYHHDYCALSPSNTFNVYFHNGKGYDFHHLLEAALTNPHLLTQEPKVFAKGLEKIDSLTFRRGNIAFSLNDTLNFLNGSLANLVKNVTDFKYTPEDERNNKQAFPYFWFDGPDKLHVTMQDMPEEMSAYWNSSRLHFEDKEAILRNFQKYNFATFKDYMRFYNLTDVLQLADVFENFRTAGFIAYELDPAFFMGTPGYTWAVAKRDAGLLPISPEYVEYEDTSLNLIHILQQNIRGGVAQVMEGHFKVREGHNDYLLALDVNSLYSWCLSKRLPTLFLGMGDSIPDDHDSYGDESLTTFICCVDFEYPDELHDAHRFFPLAPEHAEGRLLTTFWKKKSYVCTADEYNFYVKHGLIMTKCEWVAFYTNEDVFSKYVTNNIRMRQAAVSQGDKMSSELYKLMNNSLYGRCIMNPAKFKNISILHGKEDDVDYHNDINKKLDGAKNWIEFKKDDITGFIIERPVQSVKWEYPNQIGFGVLGYAKVKMYDMVFKLLHLFGDSLTLIYTDTDSLYFGVRDWDEHPFATLRNAHPELMDFATSNDLSYKSSPSTQKAIGLWSDDFEGKRAVEMVALRAKAYAVRFDDGKEKLKGKGISVATATIDARRDVNSERLSFKHYLDRLEGRDMIKAYHEIILRKGTNITAKTQHKVALSVADTKRLVMKDYKRLPFGYRGSLYSYQLEE